ncbi:MAG: glycine cleavage system protein GcvH [Chloroflexi bacterium]|nr:glycine cleavage system protein GcvH [Chloroflexota bacterium]
MSDKQINYAADRKYAESHEWVKLEGDLAVIGISDYAQDQLGDVVFVELPSVGAMLTAGKNLGVVESVKAASDVFAPISGKVEAINDALKDSPETVNKDALGAGWFVKIRPSNAAEMDKLLDAATYQKKIEAGEIH